MTGKNTSTAIGAALESTLSNEQKAAYEWLAGLRYPIKSRTALHEQLLKTSVPEFYEESADFWAQCITHSINNNRMPLQSAEVAIEAIHGMFQSTFIPNPEPRPINPEGIPEEPPDLGQDFGDDICGQIANRVAAEVGLSSSYYSSGYFRELFRLRSAVEACRDNMPAFPNNDCGRRARAAFADSVIRSWPLELFSAFSGYTDEQLAVLNTAQLRATFVHLICESFRPRPIIRNPRPGP